MTELLWRFRLEFHTVLVDTPPMLHLPDARILGRVSDGVILVLKAGVTTREEALAVRQRLFDDRTPIAGTVLNQWEPGQGHGGDYSYGYQGPGQLHNNGDTDRPWGTRS
jgi:Mrp family chromosome partitioning ATPase